MSHVINLASTLFPIEAQLQIGQFSLARRSEVQDGRVKSRHQAGVQIAFVFCEINGFLSGEPSLSSFHSLASVPADKFKLLSSALE